MDSIHSLRGSMRRTTSLLATALALAVHLGCTATTATDGSDPTPPGPPGPPGPPAPPPPPPVYPPLDPTAGPAAGWSGGSATVPSAGLAEVVGTPDHVVGTGTPASCTAADFIAKVAMGGKITFDCGPDPVTIRLTSPARIHNDKPSVVIDGGGLVTLSGGGTTRILYMNTCDQSLVWTTNHCQDQDLPHLTVQNLTFMDGNSMGDTTYDGGGAIWVRGGRFKVVNSRFFRNVCAATGPDVGGGAIRVFDQYQDQPVYVVHSTFGGASGYGNSGSNGGALSSIGVSWSIYNSLFSYNTAIGNGGNPAQSGTPGGGSGAAIYNDGNTMTLAIYGSLLEHNQAHDFGPAIFFVSNDLSGTLRIHDSTLRLNSGNGIWEAYPGISLMSGTATDFVNVTWQ